MNTQTHRLVFNKSRGCLKAVAENARSSGGGGRSSSRRSKRHSLSPAQQAALTQDMVWPEWQVVDGQKVLVPKLYVAHLDTNNDNNKGARIVGTDVAITTRELDNTGSFAASNSLAINASGKVSGGGSYSGGKTVAIVADSVDLKSASIQSGGWLSIDTANDLTLTATQIKADGDARLSAGGTLALNADKHEAHIVRGDGAAKMKCATKTPM